MKQSRKSIFRRCLTLVELPSLLADHHCPRVLIKIHPETPYSTNGCLCHHFHVCAVSWNVMGCRALILHWNPANKTRQGGGDTVRDGAQGRCVIRIVLNCLMFFISSMKQCIDTATGSCLALIGTHERATTSTNE
jgi:hypothetical protein